MIVGVNEISIDENLFLSISYDKFYKNEMKIYSGGFRGGGYTGYVPLHGGEKSR